MKSGLLNVFNMGKSKSRGKNVMGLNIKSDDVTSLLLVVIVVLVIYFIFLDDRRNRDPINYVDVGIDASVGLNNNTRLGLDGEMAVGNQRAGARVGLQVGEEDDEVYAKGNVSYKGKYGAMAGVGYDEDVYGLSMGYNSDREKLYLNLGELEGFDNHSGKIVPGPGKCAVVFFHATWCGYCVKFMPEWKKFKSQMNGKTVNGKQIVCIECSSEEKEKISNYGIESYPTLKLCDAQGNVISDYEGERTVAGLKKFVNNNAK